MMQAKMMLKTRLPPEKTQVVYHVIHLIYFHFAMTVGNILLLVGAESTGIYYWRVC